MSPSRPKWSRRPSQQIVGRVSLPAVLTACSNLIVLTCPPRSLAAVAATYVDRLRSDEGVGAEGGILRARGTARAADQQGGRNDNQKPNRGSLLCAHDPV